MIGLSPSSSGAVQLTCAALVIGRAVTPVGAPGAIGAVGVTAFDCAETGPPPLPLTAWTVNAIAVAGRQAADLLLGAREPATVVGASAVVPS